MKNPKIDIHPDELSKIVNLFAVIQERINQVEIHPEELIEIKKELIHIEHLIDFIEKKAS